MIINELNIIGSIPRVDLWLAKIVLSTVQIKHPYA